MTDYDESGTRVSVVTYLPNGLSVRVRYADGSERTMSRYQLVMGPDIPRDAEDRNDRSTQYPYDVP